MLTRSLHRKPSCAARPLHPRDAPIRVAVVDYGMGSLGSMANAVSHLDTAVRPDHLEDATLVLPTAGSFGDGIQRLRSRGMGEALEQTVVERGLPLLGVCLGTQLLCTIGHAGGKHNGLGRIENQVRGSRGVEVPIPIVRWNGLGLLGNGGPHGQLVGLSSSDRPAEPGRLESLWAGEFGDEYVDRNLGAYEHRQAFWAEMLSRVKPQRVLEVGCNVGGNLRWVRQHVDGDVCGVDINRKALAILRQTVDCDSVHAHGRDLPFRDGWYDLVFTMGVLIHQPDISLPVVMSEMVRCSRRWVLCGEYHADSHVEVPYRGHAGALFKRDYTSLFLELFPELQLESAGFLGHNQGWDDISWSLFEKR